MVRGVGVRSREMGKGKKRMRNEGRVSGGEGGLWGEGEEWGGKWVGGGEGGGG